MNRKISLSSRQKYYVLCIMFFALSITYGILLESDYLKFYINQEEYIGTEATIIDQYSSTGRRGQVIARYNVLKCLIDGKEIIAEISARRGDQIGDEIVVCYNINQVEELCYFTAYIPYYTKQYILTFLLGMCLIVYQIASNYKKKRICSAQIEKIYNSVGFIAVRTKSTMHPNYFAKIFENELNNSVPEVFDWFLNNCELGLLCEDGFLFQKENSKYMFVAETKRLWNEGKILDYYFVFRSVINGYHCFKFNNNKVYMLDVLNDSTLEEIGDFASYIIEYLEKRQKFNSMSSE